MRYGRRVATVDDVARIALAFPEVTEGDRHGYRTWSVRKKTFAWERPLTRADVERFGAAMPPDGPILAVRVEDLIEKEAILQERRRGFFTMAHFDGYPALLIQLRTVGTRMLREALTDAWLACAPHTLAERYLARRG